MSELVRGDQAKKRKASDEARGAWFCLQCKFLGEVAARPCSVYFCLREEGALPYVVDLRDVCSDFEMSESAREEFADAAGVRRIPLTQGKVAIVSAEDYELVAGTRWHIHRNGRTVYAQGRVGEDRKKTYMHRVIMRPGAGKVVDHVDRDGLNNTRENLRVVEQVQNTHNTGPSRGGSSKYKGVYKMRGKEKWQSQICCEGKVYYLGVFEDEVEAAKAYDEKAVELFGEFAWLNGL